MTLKSAKSEKKVKIYNLHSDSEKNAEDFKIISSDEYNLDGQLVTNKYVQYTIIGNNRTWPDFMPIEDFKRLNPKIKVKGLS